MQTEPPSSEDEAGGHLAFLSEGPHVGERVRCTKRLNPYLISDGLANDQPLVQGEVVGFLPADEAEGSSEALYQVQFDGGLLSWRGKVKVIREGKLIHILGWSMLSLDDAGNIILSKKKKHDEPSSDDDEEDDDEALARPDASREFTISVPKLVFMAFASSTISGRTEGVTNKEIQAWILESVDEWKEVTDKALLEKLGKNVRLALRGDSNYQILGEDVGSDTRWIQIPNPTKRAFQPARNTTNKPVIRIIIKGKGNAEDIRLTATDIYDATRKLQTEQGMSISRGPIRARLLGTYKGKDYKNWYRLPAPDRRKLVFKYIKRNPADEAKTDSDSEGSIDEEDPLDYGKPVPFFYDDDDDDDEPPLLLEAPPPPLSPAQKRNGWALYQCRGRWFYVWKGTHHQRERPVEPESRPQSLSVAQVKAGWRLLQDKFSGRAVYVNGDMVTDTRPDEETGEVIEPPPLSQALADMGWRKCYLPLRGWYYALDRPGLETWTQSTRPAEPLPRPEELSPALVEEGWTIIQDRRSGRSYYSCGPRVQLERPHEPPAVPATEQPVLSAADLLAGAGTVLHERGGGGDDAMDVDSVALKTVEVDCPFLHNRVVDLTKIRSDDPDFPYLAQALPGWEVERPVMYHKGIRGHWDYYLEVYYTVPEDVYDELELGESESGIKSRRIRGRRDQRSKALQDCVKKTFGNDCDSYRVRFIYKPAGAYPYVVYGQNVSEENPFAPTYYYPLEDKTAMAAADPEPSIRTLGSIETSPSTVPHIKIVRLDGYDTSITDDDGSVKVTVEVQTPLYWQAPEVVAQNPEYLHTCRTLKQYHNKKYDHLEASFQTDFTCIPSPEFLKETRRWEQHLRSQVLAGEIPRLGQWLLPAGVYWRDNGDGTFELLRDDKAVQFGDRVFALAGHPAAILSGSGQVPLLLVRHSTTDRAAKAR